MFSLIQVVSVSWIPPVVEFKTVGRVAEKVNTFNPSFPKAANS